MNQNIVYKSLLFKYPMIISIGTILFTFVLFLTKGNFIFFIGALKVQIIFGVLLSVIYTKRFTFFEKEYIVELPLRIVNRKIKREYSNIRYFEVRMWVTLYSYPKCIIHYPKWYKSEYFFTDNTFEIKNVKEILPLIENLINNNVVIKANMYQQYEKEFNALVAFIKEKNGILHPDSQII
jgi:hypothetical protein